MNRYRPLFESEHSDRILQKAIHTIDKIIATDPDKEVWKIPVGAYAKSIEMEVRKNYKDGNIKDAVQTGRLHKFQQNLIKHYVEKGWSAITHNGFDDHDPDLKHMGTDYTLVLAK